MSSCDTTNISIDSCNFHEDRRVKCIRAIKKCQSVLFAEIKSANVDNPVFDELSLTMEMMLLACRIGRSLLASGMNPRSNMGLTVINLGINSLPPTVRTDIANKLLTIIEEYRRVWLLQNYPQGLEATLYQLTAVLQKFIPDSTKLITGRLMSSISPKNSVYENGYSD